MEQLKNNTAELQEILDTINTLPEKFDTSDANATASDIVAGKTAYVKGEKIEGTVEEVVNGYWSGSQSYQFNHENIELYTTLSADQLFRKDQPFKSGTIYGFDLGFASPEQVAEGVTFTSMHGMLLTGTAKFGGTSIPSGAIVIQPSLANASSQNLSISSTSSIRYSSSISINVSNNSATVALNNAKTLSSPSTSTDFTTLRNNYITVGTIMGSSSSTIYFVPSDCTFTFTEGSNSWSADTLACTTLQQVNLTQVTT